MGDFVLILILRVWDSIHGFICYTLSITILQSLQIVSIIKISYWHYYSTSLMIYVGPNSEICVGLLFTCTKACMFFLVTSIKKSYLSDVWIWERPTKVHMFKRDQWTTYSNFVNQCILVGSIFNMIEGICCCYELLFTPHDK